MNIIASLLSYSVPEYSAYMVYLNRYGKSYGTMQELDMRMELFTQKAQEIKQLNSELTTSRVGFNEYSDWTQGELQAVFYPNGTQSKPQKTPLATSAERFLHSDAFLELREGPRKLQSSITCPTNSNQTMSVDWCNCGAVSVPQNQNSPASCASDYAFAAVAILEGAYQISLMNVAIPITSNPLPSGCNTQQPIVPGSVQQVLECSCVAPYGNSKCGFGSISNSLTYANAVPLTSSTTIPY